MASWVLSPNLAKPMAMNGMIKSVIMEKWIFWLLIKLTWFCDFLFV